MGQRQPHAWEGEAEAGKEGLEEVTKATEIKDPWRPSNQATSPSLVIKSRLLKEAVATLTQALPWGRGVARKREDNLRVSAH